MSPLPRSSAPLPPDKFKASNAFWVGLSKIGLTPAQVLRQSGLPVTLYDGEKNLMTTAQFFRLWRGLAELNPDPALALNWASQMTVEQYHPALIAALHARTYRDALIRMARYKALCSPEELRVRETKAECVIDAIWFHATEEEPHLLVDAMFGSMTELGRRGTGVMIKPKRIELMRRPEPTGVHTAYFGCPVQFNAKRNALVLHCADLDRLLVTHNAEFLEMITPSLERQLQGRGEGGKIGDRVKWILKRLLAGNRPDVVAVAKELGVSSRTLQRRITEEGGSFRQLLLEARQELVRQYLSQASIEINEAAYLLGYEDPNSFYRAFRTWEGTTPAHWRAAHRMAADLN